MTRIGKGKVMQDTVGIDVSKATLDAYWLPGKLVLSRFSSGLFRAMFAMKEIWNGEEVHRRVSA
jgi:hypothetical protein